MIEKYTFEMFILKLLCPNKTDQIAVLVKYEVCKYYKIFDATQHRQQATLYNTCISMARAFTNYNVEIRIDIKLSTKEKINK